MDKNYKIWNRLQYCLSSPNATIGDMVFQAVILKSIQKETLKISPDPSFSKRGIFVPPLAKGDEGGFECNFSIRTRFPLRISAGMTESRLLQEAL